MCKEIHHTNDSHFDIIRKEGGNNFIYKWKESNQKVDNKTLLKRIESLVIPPMWENVMICSNGCGHIQAIGYDQKNRKQYIYNPTWQEEQSIKKFNKMIDFATILPTIRRKAHSDLKKKRWTKDKALALAVLVLDEAHLRIGNYHYKNKNGTYGLTTLRRKHVDFDDKGVVFEYKAKSNKYRKVRLTNNELARLIKKSSDLPGYEIFRYHQNGRYHDIDSSDVNEYLRKVAHSKYSAKDFRTWGATAMAVELYPDSKEIVADNSRKKLDATLVKLVAKEMGNTPSICRDYYIHPAVMEAVENEEDKLLFVKNNRKHKYALSEAEKVALNIISN